MPNRFLIFLVALALMSASPLSWSDKAKGGPDLESGILLKAGGKIISDGHTAAPEAVDWDEDGKLDLLVGTFSGGKVFFYQNTGSNKAPEYKNAGALKAGGRDISLPSG